MADSECIFCRIVQGQIPCAKVYEDDVTMAFLDLGPVKPGHVLVIPKSHHENLLDTPIELAPAIFAALRKVGRAVMQATGATGFNVLQNNGSASGQAVFHVHWHIIPRVEGDGLSLWPQGAYSDQRAMQDMAARMAACLTEDSLQPSRKTGGEA